MQALDSQDYKATSLRLVKSPTEGQLVRFSLLHLCILMIVFAAVFGVIQSFFEISAILFSLSVLTLTTLSVLAFRTRYRKPARWALGLFIGAWLLSHLFAKISTSELVRSKIRANYVNSTVHSLTIDPYRNHNTYAIDSHPTPWIYTGNAWSPFPFTASIEYGTMNEYDSGAGARLYFLALPGYQYEFTSEYLWSRN
ncbi:MAG: hypothetical protein U0930_20645 [Pirellulales bacterium]